MKLLALLMLLTSPMRIYKTTTLPANGEYHQPVIIMADNLVFDCNGSTFIGDKVGVGILMQARSGVTIRNCKVRGFDVGLYGVNGKNLVIERSDFSGNYVDDNYDIENLKPIPHGGIVLNAIQNARLQGNTANGNVAGMQILNSSKIRVQQNIASRNRGWGIYLYGTTASVIYTNTVDYNNRTCPRPGGGTWEGCGSAGIVLTQQSDRNIIGWNILTANGNGIYQGNTPASASNDLEIRNNKISNSIANGIEATFSWRNYIHDNEFSDDDYGAWLGYSRDGRFEFNTVKGSRSRSVQVDNGQGWKVFDNTIVRRDAIDDRFDGRDILFQPVQGGTCKNNQFSNNKPISVTIETPGCQ